MSSKAGRLRIKGVKDPMENLSSTSKKKKKSKDSKKKSTGNEDSSISTETAIKIAAASKEKNVDSNSSPVYMRNETGFTEAELRTMLLRSKKDKENAKKIAQKSYRERIEDFNKKLSSTSEHFDMPRIGPG